MHIFFSGIGGTGIGPLALIAQQAGHEVSGSDKQESIYTKYLQDHGVAGIYIGQTRENIAEFHRAKPIDWYVYSSALPREDPNHPELAFVREMNIKNSKRDIFLKHLLLDKNLKLIAVAGTHGKTTTTAMAIWLFKQLKLPISYSVGAKIDFGEMGQYDPASNYFVYECDEFDRNFLSFEPYLSLITGVAWDHHDIYPTVDEYRYAFRDFLGQSAYKYIWQKDLDFLGTETDDSYTILPNDAPELAQITLPGAVNRQDGWLIVQGVHMITKEPVEKLVDLINKFPGVSRRMEPIAKDLYSDYAHTPEKILGGIGVAREIAAEQNKQLVVVYEPLTNRRMHFTKEAHHDIFQGVKQLYWVPSYLAREDPNQPVLTPAELITFLDPDIRSVATPMELNKTLKNTIKDHLKAGDMVVCFSGGGGGSLDEWLRKEFK